jgi:hypothetical protein
VFIGPASLPRRATRDTVNPEAFARMLTPARADLVTYVFDPRVWITAVNPKGWQALRELDPEDRDNPAHADWERYRADVQGKALGDAYERRITDTPAIQVVDSIYASQALLEATFDASPRLRRLVATVETKTAGGPVAYFLTLIPDESPDQDGLRFDLPSH